MFGSFVVNVAVASPGSRLASPLCSASPLGPLCPLLSDRSTAEIRSVFDPSASRCPWGVEKAGRQSSPGNPQLGAASALTSGAGSSTSPERPRPPAWLLCQGHHFGPRPGEEGGQTEPGDAGDKGTGPLWGCGDSDGGQGTGSVGRRSGSSPGRAPPRASGSRRRAAGRRRPPTTRRTRRRACP